MTFAIKRRPLDGTFFDFPFSKHTKKGCQCFWTKKPAFVAEKNLMALKIPLP